jgi:hypothetical protein
MIRIHRVTKSKSPRQHSEPDQYGILPTQEKQHDADHDIQYEQSEEQKRPSTNRGPILEIKTEVSDELLNSK